PSKTIEEQDIKKKFLYSDEINKNSTANLVKHSNSMYANKNTNTHEAE
ncbi:6074_t:CDS:1, partial [Dentiscutata heterogama]